MNIDLNHPFFHFDKNRKEVLVVEFDGFIKNISEGIIQYMMSEPEEWDEKYPKLYEFYDDLEFYVLYERTFLYDPFVVLRSISDDNVSDDTIFEDIEYLRQRAIIDNQCITKFEFALYRLLQEDFITKCYIIKGSQFYPNEKNYIYDMYDESIDKITLVEGGMLDIIRDGATTIFVNDMDMLFDFIVKELTKEELQNKAFIVLNNYFNTEVDESSGLLKYLFEKECEIANNSGIFTISRMYNEAIELDDDSSEDTDNEEHENEKEN